MKLSITDVPGIHVGQAEDAKALTGCTVIRTPGGAVAGVDVRGSAPGTRETDLLHPLNLVQRVHAVCLTGGSAYGLDAASGVMRYLEERGEGFDVGVAVVPIVPAAVLFDLAVGSAGVRPDQAMGYEAAGRANSDPVAEGNVGAGCGASVGKFCGIASAMKSGLGTASRRLDDGLTVGAVVAVNAVGEVRDPRTGETLAGARDGQGGFRDYFACAAHREAGDPPMSSNTTIAAVASNGKLTKAEANKVAQMAHDGLARTIHPVHTMNDGDTVFALATGRMDANVDVVGALSAQVLAEAVVRAVKSCTGAGGLPSHSEYRGSGTHG